jgi:hypothetical protein
VGLDGQWGLTVSGAGRSVGLDGQWGLTVSGAGRSVGLDGDHENMLAT